MKRSSLFIKAGVLAALVFGVLTPAAAAAEDLTVPIGTVGRGVPFSTVDVASTTVPADLVGDSCVASLLGANNESVHDNNNLIVSTGSESFTFENVESESFQQTTASGEVVLGETVLVQLQFGADGRSSGGLTLSFDCTEVVTTTTVAPTTTEAPVEVSPETTIAGEVSPTTTAVAVEVLPETQVPAALPGTAVQPATPAQPTYTG